MRVKDWTPLLFSNNIKFELPGLHCQGCKIGQTSHWPIQVISQHKSNCHFSKISCAVVNHHLKTRQQSDFVNVKIVFQEKNYKSRLFLEVIHI